MTITVTESAARRIQNYLDKRGKGIGLRLGVRRSGCSGYAYAIDFADEVGSGDQVFEDRGVKLVVKQEHLPYLDGMELDFIKDGLNEMFKFNNPNVKDSCGCGESFNI
ncbi:MAG TPA: iron-sulfur cluster assembly protein IscA [Candidatus Competibacteraceae bacterium]|nr:iron-sulfur cluster assembly protein IscA [Candidatus Competibacteraceae bacterium]